MYDAQTDSIKVEDIAINENNRLMLSRIKRNSEILNSNRRDNSLWIKSQHDEYWIRNHYGEEGNNCIEYVPEGAKDMGWLGYFIGKNDHLKHLYFRDCDAMNIDVIKPFFSGVSRNKSIASLDFRMDQLDGEIFTLLEPFFKNNSNLITLSIDEGDLDDDGWRLLALAIGSSKNKSLQNILLTESNISDEALVDIITSLSMHPQLQEINLSENRLNKNGCKALATLLQNSATQLQNLDLGDNELDDESIYALVPALKNCYQLHTLRLSRNESITSSGWQQLASILEPPTSKLIRVLLLGNNINDDALAAFASSLVNNYTLNTLKIDNNESITRGREAFLKLLCDTSSVNSTFLSNHTFNYLGTVSTNPLRPLLELNRNEDKKKVAMIKILQHHNDFDMTPFFEWEFKVLPLMMHWFERASAIPSMSLGFGQRVRRGKLSSIYQFVRGMPVEYVETRLRQELEEIKAARLQMEERERDILERLGRNA